MIADLPPQAPQVQVQQIQQKAAAQVKRSIDGMSHLRADRHLSPTKLNGGPPKHKRNRRYQMKHGFKAKQK